MDRMNELLSEANLEDARTTLLRVGEEISGAGTWVLEPSTGRVLWSENLFRLHGLDPRRESPDAARALALVHPDDRPRFEAALDAARRGEEPDSLVYRSLHADGTVRFLHARVASRYGSEGRRVLIGWLRDLTEQRWAEREIAAHIAVSRALSGWDQLEPSAERLIAAVAVAFGFTRAILWIPFGERLRPQVTWEQSDPTDLRRSVQGVALQPDEGLAGRAWQSGEPVVVASAGEEPGYAFHDAAVREDLRAAAAIPLVASGDVLGVIGLSGPEELELTDRLSATLTGLGHEIGAFLKPRLGQWGGGVLSARELEILRLAATGQSGPAIAQRLGISPATVKTHFENIYAKYEVPDRVSAVAKAMREGLIE